jgi:DeoR/GlpR family transcriptional regulator of sugar metabolism
MTSETNKKSRRQQKICDLLTKHDYLTTIQLRNLLGCSEASVRNDLREMEKNNMLKRVHGGALPTGNTSQRVGLPTRGVVFSNEKKAIAHYVVENILHPNQTIMLDAGTTTMELAEMIAELPYRLTILTNSLPAASTISRNEQHRLYFTGGMFDNTVGSCHDQQTVEMLRHLHADIFFLCPTGISIENGLAVPDQSEAAVKMVMQKNSSKTIALADHSKFNKTSFFSLCQLTEVSQIITDSNLAPEEVERFRNAGLNLELAPIPREV